jgi:glyoxylase-like metal-dependent hydrolase (beta-lactamase superfamily II)
MFFKQFYLESLGHASYFVGSEETGEALVLDVRRDVDPYFAEARNQGMRIRYACDTHQHNDYVTGICELPERGDFRLLAHISDTKGFLGQCMDLSDLPTVPWRRSAAAATAPRWRPAFSNAGATRRLQMCSAA